MTMMLGWFVQIRPWHEGGMFLGMHWVWWLLWAGTLLVIGWAFVRLSADRSESHQSALRKEAAEQTLRQRFAAGEIGEEEYAHRMRVLRETPPGG